MINKLIINTCFLLISCWAQAQLEVNSLDITDSNLLEDLIIQELLGCDVVIDNVVYVGNAEAFGTFNYIQNDALCATDFSVLGLNRGLLLTTGSINYAVGPNNDGDDGQEWNVQYEDDLLHQYLVDSEVITPSVNLFDAAVLEFDITSSTVNSLGFEVVFGVIIGTGVGGGISINQKVIRGRNSISGEWGHIVLPSRTEDEKKYVKKCYCGKDGCLETYISGPGFSSVYNLRCNKNYNSHQILDGFNNKEKDSIFALNQYVDHLARGLSLVCNILDPDVIVLGGGMSNIDFIYENINDALKKYVFTDTLHTKVVKNIHGDSSGVRGAAWLS